MLMHDDDGFDYHDGDDDDDGCCRCYCHVHRRHDCFRCSPCVYYVLNPFTSVVLVKESVTERVTDSTGQLDEGFDSWHSCFGRA